MKRILAIDPGTRGGLAWTNGEGGTFAEPMPQGMTAQVERIREIWAESAGNLSAVMEQVHAMPTDGKVSLAKFMRHSGWLDAALYTIGIPTTVVAPGMWQKTMGQAMPHEKGDRKRLIRDLMQRRYPYLKVTLRTADALAILTWAMRQADQLPPLFAPDNMPRPSRRTEARSNE